MWIAIVPAENVQELINTLTARLYRGRMVRLRGDRQADGLWRCEVELGEPMPEIVQPRAFRPSRVIETHESVNVPAVLDALAINWRDA